MGLGQQLLHLKNARGVVRVWYDDCRHTNTQTYRRHTNTYKHIHTYIHTYIQTADLSALGALIGDFPSLVLLIVVGTHPQQLRHD